MRYHHEELGTKNYETEIQFLQITRECHKEEQRTIEGNKTRTKKCIERRMEKG